MNIKIIQSTVKLFLIIVLLFATQKVAANNVIMYTKMDSSAIWIGEETSIKLEVVQDKDATVNIVIPEKTWTPEVEVKRVSKADTVNIKNNRIQINREIIITSFDSGFHAMPPIVSILGNDTFATDPLFLKVVPPFVDQAKLEIKDINDTLRQPRFVIFDYIPWYAWVILAVLILVGIGIYIYFKHFRHKVKVVKEFVPKIPPHIKAIEALRGLKEEKLWQAGQEKEYFTRLIDILREYIDSRFSINAMEMTSSEILNSLRKNKESKLVEANIRKILEVADYVKFAKMHPLPEDNEMAMRNAIDFVELTIPQEENINKEEKK